MFTLAGVPGKKPYLPYNKNLKEFSRNLRNNSTLGEVLLWKALRAGNIGGYKFNRQKPIDNYIVDFYCKKLNLVIEIDGYSHNFKSAKDEMRDKKLAESGISVLRFSERMVKKEMPNVLRAIEDFIERFEENP